MSLPRPNSPRTAELGFSLVEVMVAVVLLAGFFASIFQLNAMCLRSINSSKESLGALQGVQDRTERLRNIAFADLTTPAFVQALLATRANPSPFLAKATEVVTISNYNPAATPPITSDGVTRFTRSPNGTVTTNSTATTLPSGLVQVDVAISWSRTIGGGPRIEQASTIISNGTKR
ncbi:MAG: prepilin-type N-terminal cleavage/methylation domain-containing protein [Chthoniobacterales bacterium]